MIAIERNSHKGERCFIIGSGPSIHGMDLELLRNETTIAVNESYRILPFAPSYIGISDYKLWSKVKDAYSAMKSTLVVTSTGIDGTCGGEYIGNNLKARLELYNESVMSETGFHWDLDSQPLAKAWGVIPELVLPFVCWCGFSECYLLGVDCKENGYSFKNPVRGIHNQKIDRRVFLSYEAIALTPNKPTKIYNATPDTALHAFRKVEYSSIFENKTRIKDFQFVGYYTPNQDYPELARRMRDSVMRQGFECDIFERPNMSTQYENLPVPMPWVLNCSQCAQFCLEMFERYTDKHIFYLDADAVMERFPALLTGSNLSGIDVAAPFLTNEYVQNELVSNSLIFMRTSESHRILKQWVAETNQRISNMLDLHYASPYREAWDQKTLQDVIEREPCSLYRLPWTYAKITRTSFGVELMKGVEEGEIVISQHQASRKNKMKR